MQPSLELDVILIPAGECIIGSNRADRLAGDDERPQHRLTVSDFHIMRYPVTNSQYRLFVAAIGHRSSLFWKDGQYPAAAADHPVVGVSFHDAVAFCRWAREITGLPLRLPMEVEWEKAARGRTPVPVGGDRHEARCACRSWAAPMHRSDDTGFRCCYEL